MKLDAAQITRFETFLDTIAGQTYPEVPSRGHDEISAQMMERFWTTCRPLATAVVLMLYTQQATVGRTPTDRSAQFLITDIWVKRKGAWRVAERHSSRPEQPPTPRPTP